MTFPSIPRRAVTLLRPWLAGIAFASFGATAQAPEDVRVALVIGNSAYPGNAALANPANDARAMAEVLGRAGFKVVQAQDADKAGMLDAIAQVTASLNGRQGIGMLYYAGHALQLDWRNYMVPVDARLARAADVPAQTVDVAQVLDAFKGAGTRVNIIVLDACRDNPFAGAASSKGLAQLDAPPGTFLAFATAPGHVAQDGEEGGNGLYTRYLLQEISKPQARIEDVFKRVRLQVRQKSQGRQVPWEGTSLEDDFFFDSGKKAEAPAEAEKAKLFAQEKADWDRIKDSRAPEDIYAFLQKYPTGSISELAQSRLERLDVAKVQPQPDRNGLEQSAAQVWNRVGDRYKLVWKDGYTGAVLSTEEAVVDKIVGDTVEGTVGNFKVRSTQAGEVSDGTFGSFDPPIMARPAGVLQVGSKWAGRSDFTLRTNRKKRSVDWRGRVVARERITVPAGTFDTFKIELNMLLEDGMRVNQAFWYVPGMAYALRFEHEERTSGAPGRRTREMVSFTLGAP